MQFQDFGPPTDPAAERDDGGILKPALGPAVLAREHAQKIERVGILRPLLDRLPGECERTLKVAGAGFRARGVQACLASGGRSVAGLGDYTLPSLQPPGLVVIG